MRQITLNIKESRYSFFIELIKSFDFVQIEEEHDSKEAIIRNIQAGIEEVNQVKAGKLKTTAAKDFLNEL